MKAWIVSLMVLGVGMTPSIAQEEEGGGGGINTPSGLGDLRSSQQRGPFSDFPWDVQSLLEKHVDVLRKLPAPVKNHVLQGAMDWDVWFEAEKQRLIMFLKKTKALSADEMTTLWQDVEMQGFAIDGVIDRLVLEDVKPAPALVVVAVSQKASMRVGSVVSKDMLKNGTLLEQVDFGSGWLDTFLTGYSPGNLTLLEQVRKARKLKQANQTIAVVDQVPMVMAGKPKGDRKKFAPLLISAAELQPTLQIGENLLSQASGKSEKYVDMMMSQWTPESLKMPQTYQEKSIGFLAIRSMIVPEQALTLGDVFVQKMALRLLWRAQPDAMLVAFSDDDEVECQIFLDRLAVGLKNRARYDQNTLLAVLDAGKNQVFVYGVGADSGLWQLGTVGDFSKQVALTLGVAGMNAQK